MPNNKISITQEEFNLFREYIQQECGIIVNDDKAYLVESRLNQMIVEGNHKSYKELYLTVKQDTTGKLKNKIVDSMTTNETMWFRDQKHWNFFRDVLIPKYINELRKGERKKVYIWSTASSTGQEPYSMAMLVYDALKKEPKVNKEQFMIIATDISINAIFLASSGRYNSVEMSRGMLPNYKIKYFKESNGIAEINPEIKRMVTFKQFNLQSSFEIFPKFDIILCRNVAIYFSPDVTRMSILQFKVLLIIFRPPLQDILSVVYYSTFLISNQSSLWFESFSCAIEF
jgi:chemotaxis protein methyltransferase CheR